MKTFLLLLVNQSLNIYNSIFNIIEKKEDNSCKKYSSFTRLSILINIAVYLFLSHTHIHAYIYSFPHFLYA